MNTALLTRSNVTEVLISLVFGLVAIVLAWASFGSWSSWYHAQPPQGSAELYLTSGAEVVPALRYDPGLPAIEVPFSTFVQLRSASHLPYLVSYWSGWEKGEHPEFSRDPAWLVTYAMLDTGPSGQRFVYAKVSIPDYSIDTYGYRAQTVFDAERKAFVLQVTGASYKELWGTALLVLFTLLCIGVSIIAGGIFWEDNRHLF